MSSSIIEKSEKINKEINPETFSDTKCFKCGGNGYVKSSPNRYHTCLDCFGKGFLRQGSSSSTIK